MLSAVALGGVRAIHSSEWQFRSVPVPAVVSVPGLGPSDEGSLFVTLSWDEDRSSSGKSYPFCLGFLLAKRLTVSQRLLPSSSSSWAVFLLFASRSISASLMRREISSSSSMLRAFPPSRIRWRFIGLIR